MLRKLRSRWKRIRKTPSVPTDFDAVFYATHHADLRHLRTPERLWAHYINDGQREGRPRNFPEAMGMWQERYGRLPTDFNIAAYKLLNEDLAANFAHDHRFIRHFLEHGRREGRPYRIDEPLPSSAEGIPLLAGAWPALFRTAEFVAMSQDWLPRCPLPRAQALRLFVEQGVARLSPVSFRHSFDPAFYQETYRLPYLDDDAALYRNWLEEGVSAGRAPNEKIFLQPYLGLRDYPGDFDWQAYRSHLAVKERHELINRAEVLAHFFEHDSELSEKKAFAVDFELLEAVGDFQLHRERQLQAAQLYDLAEQAEPGRPSGTFLYRRGKARRGHSNALALHDFCAAMEKEDGPWEAVEAAIDLLVDRQAFDRAFEILCREKARWAKRAEFLVLVHRTLDACFDHAKAMALDLYGRTEPADASATITTSLRQILKTLEALEPLPPVLPVPAHGTVVILANQDLPQCRHYRVEQKLHQFKKAGLAAQAFSEAQVTDFITALAGAKAAIFYRVIATPDILRAMLYARALGVPTYYEVDDLLFDARYFPDRFESYEGQVSRLDYCHLELGVPLHRFAMSMCDIAIASTPSLADHMKSMVRSGRAILLRNGLDERNDHAISLGNQTKPAREAITLFYGSGTKAHNADFTQNLAPAILELFEKYPQLRLVVAGYLQLGPEFSRHAARINHVGFIGDLDEYWSLLRASDINLAVLSPGEMADCKSEIKWLEAAMLGVPSVVSSTATYRDLLTHGIDALLVDRPDEWQSTLEGLIQDPASIDRIGERARRKVLREYGLETGAAVLAAEFGTPNTVAVEHKRSPRLKVLICNVFFAPQSFGGSTRVVQDNVDYLIEHCPDVEVSIFSSDEGRLPEGNLRCDSYRGRPVFRVSPPQEKLRDWRPFNAQHETAFRKVLDLIQPDIVHFHCIQRLTASIVDITARSGIPYFITLHDGWWISDSGFFVDRDGNLQLPSQDPFKTCSLDGVSLSQSVARRLALGRLLAGAREILSVSAAFAEVYRRAGVAKVSVLENGVSVLRPEPRRARLDGRLSLGHLGDRSVHKGAVLVEAALRRGAYDRLALTMIDNTLSPGERIQTSWGKSPVLLRGPCAQDRVTEIYAELDVLLAPSIWPESFGLVAREAIALGLKVVASDRGAIGACVVSPCNGAIIDVSSIGAIERVLSEMNAAPQNWRARASDSMPRMRSSGDQGAELAHLYRSTGQA